MIYPEHLVLDKGSVRLVEVSGHGDAGVMGAGVVEAARQSTQGGFQGWTDDLWLVDYMATHNHSTPFEFCWAVFECRVPIFVLRQWIRHRIFSINEASARYGKLDLGWYLPTVEHLMRDPSGSNKQSMSTGARLTEARAQGFRIQLDDHCTEWLLDYEAALRHGVMKEDARIGMPVNCYSHLRLATSLRGWDGFVALRDHPHAQWEIRQYAKKLDAILLEQYPEVWGAMKTKRERSRNVDELHDKIRRMEKRLSKMQERNRELAVELKGHQDRDRP